MARQRQVLSAPTVDFKCSLRVRLAGLELPTTAPIAPAPTDQEDSA